MPVQNYEQLNIGPNGDVTTTRTLLHEAIPLTGTIVSGTYGEFHSERNIKNYAHGMFQSVYDYPYLSSSANHIFDVAVGYDNRSSLSASTGTPVQRSKKINLYNQYAQVLLGYTGSTNEVEIFESDLNFGDNDNQMKDVFFLNFSRLITKDQIKEGSFSISLGTGSWDTPFSNGADDAQMILTLTDASASTNGDGTKNTNGGDYGVLYQDLGAGGTAHGIIFYQAGLAIITASVFANGDGTVLDDFYKRGANTWSPSGSWVSASISGSCDAIRHRLYSLSFTNSTEINSTIYFCRVPHNKYNYSSNPTYTSGSKIRVKSVASDMPISYITTVGLYSENNELLAVAKLSEPLRKDPTNEITLRVRLDY
jgi:hypothetical protein